MWNLTGKVSLITGGAQGLGRAFAEALLNHGAKVCIADIDQKQGERTLKALSEKHGSGRVEFVKCDVTSQDDMENAFRVAKSTFNGLDLVCNNAGIGGEQDWDKMIQINLTSVVRGTMLAINNMSKQNGGNGGTIINVSSLAGLVTLHHTPTYCATKFGVLSYTRAWAKNPECKSMGLRFHALCPGFAKTQIVDNTPGRLYDPEGVDKLLQQFGMMTPETVANAFITLAQRDDSTGEVLSVAENTGVHWEQEVPYAKL